MSQDRDFVYSNVASRLTFGPTTSGVYGVTVTAGQNAIIFKLLSGGTFEIVSGSSFVAGNGYPLGANEVLTLDSSGTIWCMASGATCVVATLKGNSGS